MRKNKNSVDVKVIQVTFLNKKKVFETLFGAQRPEDVGTLTSGILAGLTKRFMLGVSSLMLDMSDAMSPTVVAGRISSLLEQFEKLSFVQPTTLWIFVSVPVPNSQSVVYTNTTKVPEYCTPTTCYERYEHIMTVNEYIERFTELCRPDLEEANSFLRQVDHYLWRKINIVRTEGNLSIALQNDAFSEEEKVLLEAWELLSGNPAWLKAFWKNV